MVLNPLKIQEKYKKNIQKKIFLASYPGSESPILGPKKRSNFFWLQLVPGTTIYKKILNT